jgi:hypothetical protein
MTLLFISVAVLTVVGFAAYVAMADKYVHRGK